MVRGSVTVKTLFTASWPVTTMVDEGAVRTSGAFTLRSQLNQMRVAVVRPGTRKKVAKELQSDGWSTSQVSPLPVQELLTTLTQPGGRPLLAVIVDLASASSAA